MGKYTAGKWKVSQGGYMSPISVMNDNGDVQICSSIKTIANANLIASAPDLLEALKAMAIQYKIEHGLDGAYDEVLTKAEKAIAKAEER